MQRSLRTALALSLLLLTLPSGVRSQDKPPEDPFAANKALVRRYLSEVLSAGRLELLDDLLSPDFVDSTPGAPRDVRGPELVRTAQRRAREIFPEVEYKVEDLIAEGDKVVARYTVRATSRSTGSSPGRPIEVTGITVFRIAEGQIRETWIVNAQVEMFLQLGYTLEAPKPAPAPGN